jgi:ABC-type phosphate transport system substrate-binding protein
MKTLSKAGIGAIGAIAIVLTQVTPAMADLAPQANDVVGVGSDTAQFGVEFLADGDQNGDIGYNASNTSHRMASFDATGDAYGTTTASAMILLRANSVPILRPNGSGAGITALNKDTGSTETINFVRASRLPTSAEQGAAQTNGWGGLHVYQFATDTLKVAVSNKVTTDAPAALTPTDLVNIYQGTYTTWGQVPGYAGPAPTAAIKPFIPQAGSGTRNFFLADLKAANNNVDVTLSSSVQTMQEHDPALIMSNADAVAPFSLGRFNLLNTGYLGATNKNSVAVLTGTGSYSNTRGLYVIVRERDVADTTAPVSLSGISFPFQVGGTKNWVQTLFAGTTSWMGRSANASLINSAGVTRSYADLGDVFSG